MIINTFNTLEQEKILKEYQQFNLCISKYNWEGITYP